MSDLVLAKAHPRINYYSQRDGVFSLAGIQSLLKPGGGAISSQTIRSASERWDSPKEKEGFCVQRKSTEQAKPQVIMQQSSFKSLERAWGASLIHFSLGLFSVLSSLPSGSNPQTNKKSKSYYFHWITAPTTIKQEPIYQQRNSFHEISWLVLQPQQLSAGIIRHQKLFTQTPTY